MQEHNGKSLANYFGLIASMKETYTTVSCKPAICISLNVPDTEIHVQLMEKKGEQEDIKYLYFRGRKNEIL